MSDHNPPQPDPTPEEASPPGRAARWRASVRERAARIRKGVALAVAAALLLGGAGGFALGLLVGHDRGPGDRGDWAGHTGRPGVPGQDDDRQGPPPGVPGQLPPTTREDEADPGLNG